jgi:hypothetical protein
MFDFFKKKATETGANPDHNIWLKFDYGGFISGEAKLDPWGELYCRLYDSEHVSFYLKLNDDGTVSSKDHQEIIAWRYQDGREPAQRRKTIRNTAQWS